MTALRMATIGLGGLLVLRYLRLVLRPFIDEKRWLVLAGGLFAMTPSQVVVQMAWRSVANPLVFAVSHL